MSRQRDKLQAYAEALVAALAHMGVDWVDWRVTEGQLLLDVRPSEVFPFSLRVVPRANEDTCFVTNNLAGVSYMTADGTGGLENIDTIRSVSWTVLNLIDSDTVDAVSAYSNDEWDRITRVDEKAIVRAGLLAASIISIDDTKVALDTLAAEVPFMLPAEDDMSVPTGTGGTSGGEKHRRIYIGVDAQAVRRVRDLDRTLQTSQDRASKAAATAEMAALFGVPTCCARTYVDHLADESGEAEQIAWLRHFAQRAEEHPRGALPPVHPRETNYLAARSHKLAFFDYWPCSPHCEKTIERNRRRIADLYDAESRRVLEQILGTSYMGWADGRLLPFRIEGIDGGTLRVSDAQRAAWAGLALDEFRRFYCPSIPGGGRAADLCGLRPTRGGGWRWYNGERWRRIEGDKDGLFRQQPPVVVLFGDV